MSFLRLASIILLAVSPTSCMPRKYNTAQTKDAWNSANDPGLFGADMNRNYAELPKTGQIQEPWSDSYWPSYQGGIASRWLTGNNQAWTYDLLSIEDLKGLNEDTMKLLSPAEKLDIYAGRYDYPTTKAERSRTSSEAQHWEGLCHAWTPASLAFAEPEPITLKNADGISIPFGASDIKALLIYAVHHNMNNVRTLFAGTRCEDDAAHRDWGSETPCKDINAGSFHVILTNMLGLKKTGFVIDVTRESQVWNQPVFAYTITEGARTQGASSGAAPGTVSELEITAEVRYGLEISPMWDSVLKSGQNKSTSVIYRYRLELDANDKILGGEFITEAQPDFAWALSSNINLEGNTGPGGVSFALVKEIWKKSLGQ